LPVHTLLVVVVVGNDTQDLLAPVALGAVARHPIQAQEPLGP
jgi:hypothetical protein